jgi:uncharacterized membrane protein
MKIDLSWLSFVKKNKSINIDFYLSAILIILISDFFIIRRIDSLWVFPTLMFLLPGYLLRKLIVRTSLSFVDCLGYTIGLAILLGELIGLFNSGFRAIFGFGGLDTNWLILSYTLIIFLLLGFAKKAKLSIDHLKIINDLSTQTYILCTLVILLPLLSALGAIRLNNGGNALLTISMLLISIFLFGYLLFKNKSLPSGIFLFFLLSSSLSFLWMYSLRSHYLVGFDIQQELGVAQLTQHQHMWAIALSHNPFNAMLSITVLPVLLANVLHCSLLTVFKVLIPFIFSFIALIIYRLCVQIYKSKPIALSASFFFIAQYQFMEEMPALARQEFGFLFFTLFLGVFFHNRLANSEKKILLYLLALGLIVSHYSTAYIAIGLFVFAYLSTRILSKKVLRQNTAKELGRPGIQGLLIISMILFAFLWNFQFTQSSHNVQHFIASSFKTLGFENGSNGQEGIVNGSAESSPLLFKQYFAQAKKKYTTKNFIPLSVSQDTNGATLSASGSRLEGVKNNLAYQSSSALQSVLPIIERFGIVIGCILIFYKSIREKKSLLFEYGLMSLSAICFIALIEIVPGWSAQYNTERLMQQALILLAPMFMFGGFWVFRRVNLKAAILFIFFVPAFTLLFSSGLMAQAFGGTAELNLNNYGENYDRYYISKSEVLAADWLSRQYHSPTYVYADRYAALRLIDYTNLPEYDRNDILPQTIDKHAYVYASRENTVLGIEKNAYGSGVVTFEFPNNFLRANKNVVYTNGDTNIYK